MGRKRMAVKKKSVGAQLQRKLDGHLKSRAEVRQALKRMEQLADEIAEIEERHGLAGMREEAVRLKKAACNYMVEHEMETLELDKRTGKYARLVRGEYDGHFVVTEDELGADTPTEAVSLRTIFKRKFGKGFMDMWKIATKRVADPEGIQDLMRKGIISDEDVAPAYVVKDKAPYLRIFGKDES
jgi:hypothetical protein